VLLAIEAFFITLIGAFLGLIVTLPILLWFHNHPIQLSGDLAMTMEEMGFEPIIPFSLAPELFLGQLLIILIMLAICTCYPLVRIGRLRLAASLKGGL
jgi:ABC-type lipoprotein release transport system permease subunit